MFFGPKKFVGLVFLDCPDRSGVIKLKRLIVVHFSSLHGYNSIFVVAQTHVQIFQAQLDLLQGWVELSFICCE